MILVSRTHQHGPQTQLAISASGGNSTRMHLDAPPVHFFWKRNFTWEFLGSEGTYVTLVVSRAQWWHFRGAYETGKHKKKPKHKSKRNIEICMWEMLLRFHNTATRAQPDPWSYHLGPYGQSSRVIFKDIALFCIFFTLREAKFC